MMSDIVSGFLSGLIVGFVMLSIAHGWIVDDWIKAGIFDRNGKAYRIEEFHP